MPAEGEEMHSPGPFSRGELPRATADILERLRTRNPRVHCITNAVAQNFTANALLAAGCVPSMTIAPEEIGPFVAGADALLVNLGTFDAERREAVDIAVRTTTDKGIAWVLDPVFIDRSEKRAAFARTLVDCGPTAIRLNGAEFSTLAGQGGDAGTVADYARSHGCVVVLSGRTDLVSDGARAAAIANGDPLMAKVTAMGCAASAVTAACLAVEGDTFKAAAAGLVIIGVAGELAAREARGPGSFAAAFLDALHALDGASLVECARVS
jgi:hydroxyethylthiazole kinase